VHPPGLEKERRHLQKKTLRASEQDRQDVREKRGQWRVRSAAFKAQSLVFVDESSAKTNMTRLYGWARAGERAHDHAPHGHGATRTMISSLRLDGSTACRTVDCATDGDIFEAYVRRVLAPTLRRGDCVVLDNLSSHKRPRIARLIRARGARLLFLPPYSPDFNPIEKMWSKVKSILRSLQPRTSEQLHAAITYALRQVTTEDAHAFFKSCGYNNY
jgi:transposase